jgi:hypothetical protein
MKRMAGDSRWSIGTLTEIEDHLCRHSCRGTHRQHLGQHCSRGPHPIRHLITDTTHKRFLDLAWEVSLRWSAMGRQNKWDELHYLTRWGGGERFMVEDRNGLNYGGDSFLCWSRCSRRQQRPGREASRHHTKDLGPLRADCVKPYLALLRLML